MGVRGGARVHVQKFVRDTVALPPLHRLQAVLKIGDSPVLDNIRSVLEKIPVDDVLYISHTGIIA